MNTGHAPADTTMMGVVHDALRRDLARFHTAFTAAPAPEATQLRALGRHAAWMMDFLERHHNGEDHGLWPLLRQRDPHSRPLLDRMHTDHANIAVTADAVRSAARRCTLDADERSADDLHRALDTLTAPLATHLRSEEDDVLPIVSATLTDREWRTWDKDYNIRGKSLSQLAADGQWLMDNLDPDRYHHLTHLVPAPIRLVIVKGFARRYQRACTTRWGRQPRLGGTEAALRSL